MTQIYTRHGEDSLHSTQEDTTVNLRGHLKWSRVLGRRRRLRPPIRPQDGLGAEDDNGSAETLEQLPVPVEVPRARNVNPMHSTAAAENQGEYRQAVSRSMSKLTNGTATAW